VFTGVAATSGTGGFLVNHPDVSNFLVRCVIGIPLNSDPVPDGMWQFSITDPGFPKPGQYIQPID
jgi:hypothetical protein